MPTPGALLERYITEPKRARELVDFARHHGYRIDELIEIIEDVG